MHGSNADGGAHGPGAAGAHGHHEHLHDAPPSMAIPLVLLAIGSVVAGYVGVPHALGGSNRIEGFLEPSFHPARYVAAQRAEPVASGTEAHGAAEPVEAHGSEPAPAVAAPPGAAVHDEAGAGHGADVGTERTLMGVSSAIALAGIGLAAFFFLGGGARADAVARSLPGVHRALLNRYWIDELYDAAIVQPIKRTSETVLWKTIDVGLIDGLVNGTGTLVRGGAAVMRLAQTGSVRVYAASLFIGVLLVLGYVLSR